MLIQQIMTRDVECVTPQTPVAEAAAMMKNLDVGVLPVSQDGKLAGMVTDRDITIRATAGGSSPQDYTVKDVMTPDVVYVFEDQDIRDAAQIMEVKQVRRLPVLNRNMELVGIVSLGDVATSAPDKSAVGEALGGISTPSEPKR